MVFHNAHADQQIFLGILSRCGLTWIQSTAIWYEEHKHKKKPQVCRTCFERFADYKIKWKSVNKKWYTTYHCVDCISSHVESYLTGLLDHVQRWKPLDHEPLALSITLTAENNQESGYDLKKIAKNYLGSLTPSAHEETPGEILQREIMKFLRDKATTAFEELRERFLDFEEELFIDTLTELMSEGKIYEPEIDVFKIIV